MLPIWMFDARCDRMRIDSAPRVAIEALADLNGLLGAITKKLDLSASSTEIGSHEATDPTHAQTTNRVAVPASADASAVDRAAGAVSPRGDPTPLADARATRARGSKQRRRGGTR